MKTDECIQQFIRDNKSRFVKETILAYERNVSQFLSHAQKSFNEVNAKDVRNWMVYLTDKGYKSSTINQRIFKLKGFFAYCLEEKLITYNPMESIPIFNLGEWNPHYLMPFQLERLREIAKGNKRDRAIIELLFATGIRITELVSLCKDDIVWEERMIYIKKGKGKKGRIVLFTQTCEAYLKTYLEERKDSDAHLIGKDQGTGPVIQRTIQQKFQKYEKQLGFRVTPHTMRHTFAAHLAYKGMPLSCIQSLLGHETPKVTQAYARLYNHARKEMYDEWM